MTRVFNRCQRLEAGVVIYFESELLIASLARVENPCHKKPIHHDKERTTSYGMQRVRDAPVVFQTMWNWPGNDGTGRTAGPFKRVRVIRRFARQSSGPACP